MVKKILIGLMVTALITLVALPLLAQQEEIRVIYDEGQAQATIKSLTFQGTNFIYLKEMVNLFRLDLEWEAITKKVILTSGPDQVIFFVGSSQIMVNDRIKKIIQPPRFSNGAIVLPVEFLSEILDGVLKAKIDWDPKTRILKVSGGRLNVREVRHSSYLDSTRIVIDLLKPLNYRVRKDLPAQVTIDIYDGECNPDQLSLEINDGRVKNIQAFQLPNATQIVIKLPKDLPYKDFTLKNPDRIILDINPPQKRLGYKITTIVIDPGHGGKDPGAIGRGGTREKDVVLAIAKELKNLVSERLGIRVVLTRTGDYFVPLRERTAMANNEKANLFISIHANAALGRARGEGFETYYHSLALTKEAKAVARFENSAIKLEKGSEEPMDQAEFILWDMAHNTYLNESSELAILVQEELSKKLKIRNRKVGQAHFYVLSGADMPSILVEVAFISNPREENMLRNPDFQKRVAEGLYNAIVVYKRSYERSMGLVGAD
ncbi:N-acetylmuramoyl-L-alanine amidase family protein [bacterium]|nr:N-acetylmuramoyl-L-alanine amidase family protein [bacterium]MBU4560763.1 N-acetylmuramoyl-L-alanine amidase family protein [bacterium]MCG2676162.1 N-acetylmuramoyl-L-alanine amidase family protein [bacterium]MCG2677686.1 N-acetylmuramoyl-L-alanine amidase family protein [bacterium]